ncbi:phosphoenolpyruvate carboxykinase (ATP) [Patescibacteria group bacterium]|nr:phosphoenolpyruvate carboxykinase (ATP) [Patescibacteria group bacterium]
MPTRLKQLGIKFKGKLHKNISVDKSLKKSLEREEGELNKTGALTVKTGKYTGRSPDDRFIVDDPLVHDKINWGKTNIPISFENYKRLYNHMISHLSKAKELFIFDGFIGADPRHSLPVRVVNEFAYHNLAIGQLLRRPTSEELSSHNPGFTVLVAPNCEADPKEHGVNSKAFILINFKEKIVLIGTSRYTGEIKKSLFTVMNYLLPQKDILPMHCSANIGKDGATALFFGLSGTGKTTLSADPNRKLIGDDEHGWSPEGIFNFEGGCYAKCINLTRENEPQIYDAIKTGAVVENVVMDPKTKEYDFADSSMTENTRVAYPVDFIPNAELSGMGGHPKTIIFLTADAFGVLPPVAKLNHEQAMYHFMSGYTSKLAGTERGIKEPQATFSAFFGEPFMPSKPMIYASLLRKYISKYGANVFLINTGWSGGPYGTGERISIKLTRAMVTAALEGELEKIEYQKHPLFNLDMPKTCPSVPSEILNPINTWEDKSSYEKKARELAKLFKDNFEKFKEAPDEIRSAGPI